MKMNNKKGFTLVELVIVVAVMAVLVAVAIPTVGAITSKARAAVNDSNAQTIESIIKLQEAEAEIDTETTAVLEAAGVKTALEEAKLGIDDGSFFYDSTSGKVSSVESKPTTGTGVYINFATASGVTTITTEDIGG